MSLIRFASAYAFRFSGAMIALCLLTFSCLAQNGSQGTINVTVVDSTGAVVGGAEVQLKDATTNDTRTAVTGDRGTYTFVNLPIGIYALTVSKTGFDTTSLESVRASAAQVTDLTVTLKIGVTTQVVEIKGESAPVIETTSSAISTTIDMKQIEDLPIAGRDLTSLSYTVPGYTGAFSGLPSIAEGNNIDGIIGSTSRMKFTGNSQAIVSPRLEDIQEMTVQTDQLDLGSGYGQSNMQINYVTRRGGNSYHGPVTAPAENTSRTGQDAPSSWVEGQVRRRSQSRAAASARSSAPPSPCQALPCMQASTCGACAATPASSAAVCGAWAK